MSSASLAEEFGAPSTQAPLSVPLRNIFLTLTLTVASLALAGFLWREQGYEMLIVTMGWPHVILGFIFYFGKVVRGEAKARGAFVLLALFTLAIWLIHYNYAITGLIYIYFLYHAFRDEISVYLQTRARHRPGTGLYAVAGVGPAILLMLLIPQQQNFRHDLRRVEFSGNQVAENWTLINFMPVPNSRGRDFYFYLQAPHTAGLRAFTTEATLADSRGDGEALVGDDKWEQAADLVFEPHYSDDQSASPQTATTGDVPVLLTGGHRVGQSFRAGKNDLDGIWLPINHLEDNGEATSFVLHLASPPLLPFPTPLQYARLALLILLGVIVAWTLLTQRKTNQQVWICVIVILAGLFLTQTVLKTSNNAGYPFPLIFQFVVVFHYWSWYVFSFDKLRALKRASPMLNPNAGPYDRILARFRPAPNFTALVILLNLLSGVGVFWYYKLGGPIALRYGFDYNYFLYFLIFHVTFSFNPKAGQRLESPRSPAPVAT